MSYIIWEGKRVAPPLDNYGEDHIIAFKLSHDSGLVSVSDTGIAMLRAPNASNFPIPIGRNFRLMIEEVQWIPEDEST